MVEAEVHAVLTVCGIAELAARMVFIDREGFDTVETFGDLSGDTDVTEMVKRMASRSLVAQGRALIGTCQVKHMQALVCWVKDSQ